MTARSPRSSGVVLSSIRFCDRIRLCPVRGCPLPGPRLPALGSVPAWPLPPEPEELLASSACLGFPLLPAAFHLGDPFVEVGDFFLGDMAM